MLGYLIEQPPVPDWASAEPDETITCPRCGGISRFRDGDTDNGWTHRPGGYALSVHYDETCTGA